MNRLETLLTILMAPLQRFENACIQLLTQRTVTTAVGAQLDVLGEIVGQLRQGQTDDEYRRYINARIAVNRATGKREELISIASLIINDPSATILVQDQAIATVFIQIGGVAVDAPTMAALESLLGDAVAIGVRLEVQSSSVPSTATFCFATGTGLGYADTRFPGVGGGAYADVRSN
jgi:hypothetical protein